MLFKAVQLVSLGKKAVSALEGPRGPEREPGELARGDTISLYWKSGSSEEDTGWFQTMRDASGAAITQEGRACKPGEATMEQPQIPQELFREYFGCTLSWAQPKAGEPRFVGRRAEI